ncbi:uncharacterized protein TNCV_2089631 [Trichonephila clavipes]|nr:uncharacterized protein TNCV_2089631 [Trichonephila clavipes]
MSRVRSINAYRKKHKCGLSYHNIAARVSRDLMTVNRLWNQWIQDDKSRLCLHYQDGHIHVWQHRGERTLAACIRHRHTGPSPDMMGWDGIRYKSRLPLVRIDDTVNSVRYISGVLRPGALTFIPAH